MNPQVETLLSTLIPEFGTSSFWWLMATSVATLAAGYIVGFTREWLHFRSLKRRERPLQSVYLSNSKTLPASATGGFLVSANVALAADSFRTLSVMWRKLFGGNIRRYERIKERARREALVRLKEAALASDANAIFNVRLESSKIKTGQSRIGGTSIEVLVYGTAVTLEGQV